jgi:lipopolysaccharide transport system ATP-binding protein
MSDNIIKVENLSKQYQLGQVGTGTLTRDLQRWYSRIRGKEDPTLKIGQENILSNRSNSTPSAPRSLILAPRSSDFVWALKDINFQVKQGEVLGIIGKNGAGKSTLLKILSQVTSPTTGEVKIKGRIASLLEVGTGFHSELTGRENVFLNGAILGMIKKEIKRKFDEIVDFSGVEKYIDTPVKRYSSGMTVRLAFAVAAHLEPEILVIDEVLAVGDAEFQNKALGKMQDVSSKEGRTVLFVSHNLTAVQRLCTKSLLLQNGKIVKEGNTENVISQYLSKNLYLTSISYCINNKIKDTFYATEDIYLNFSYRTKQGSIIFIHGLNIYNEQEINVFNSHDTTSGARGIIRKEDEIYQVQCIIPKNLLNEGIYSVSFALFSAEPYILYNHQIGILRFNIIDLIDGTSARGDYTGGFPGVIRPILEWSLKSKI